MPERQTEAQMNRPLVMEALAAPDTDTVLPDPHKYPVQALVDAPLILQFPEFLNGCEVTSLAMLFSFLDLPYSKEELAVLLPKDPAEPIFDEEGAILSWGDPDLGFVGDMVGERIGYSVNNGPLAQLLDRVYEPGSLNLTGERFEEVERAVADGRPVIIWTTEDFQPTEQWVSWVTSSGKEVKATFQEHAVLLVGYDEEYVYINNPLNGQKAEQVAKAPFVEAWKQLGQQALTVKRFE
ncbi:C39 family peptidase [Paenibacillus ginsengarvi]|nr:C39 family peptidase [Paenibacillus ginsengarvi]